MTDNFSATVAQGVGLRPDGMAVGAHYKGLPESHAGGQVAISTGLLTTWPIAGNSPRPQPQGGAVFLPLALLKLGPPFTWTPTNLNNTHSRAHQHTRDEVIHIVLRTGEAGGLVGGLARRSPTPPRSRATRRRTRRARRARRRATATSRRWRRRRRRPRAAARPRVAPPRADPRPRTTENPGQVSAGDLLRVSRQPAAAPPPRRALPAALPLHDRRRRLPRALPPSAPRVERNTCPRCRAEPATVANAPPDPPRRASGPLTL